MAINYWGLLIPLFLFPNAHGSNLISFEPQGHEKTYNSQKGPYHVHNGLAYEERGKLVGEIRGLLWERWNARQPLKLEAVFYTIEGDPTSTTFTIEHDRKGHWRMRVDSVSTIYFGTPKGRPPRRIVRKDLYDIVERIKEVKGEKLAAAIPLPDSENCSPETYRLRLKTSVSSDQRPFII